MKQMMFGGIPKETFDPDSIKVNYDRRVGKLVVRTDDYRIVFQGIMNRQSGYLERVINILSKENPKQIFLSLSPYGLDEGESTSINVDEIDTAMANRFRGKSHFKVGQSQRIIYEKVTGLKLPNIN